MSDAFPINDASGVTVPTGLARRRRLAWFAAGLVLAFGFAGACAPHPIVLPSGPGAAAPDAAAAWAEAAASCRPTSTYSAALHVTGRVEGRRLRATINGAVTSADQIRLEMPVAFGPPGFVLAGGAGHATLLLPRDHEVVTAPPDQIVRALIGLPLGPRALLAVLAGCAVQSTDLARAVRYGDLVAVTTSGGRVFLREQAGHWRIVAADLGEWVVEYQAFDGPWPSALRLASAAGRTPVIALSVEIRQMEVNRTFTTADFSLAVPPGTMPRSIDELHRGGPMADTRP